MKEDTIKTWDALAPHWDKTITAHGNIYWKRLQAPCLERLLSGQVTTDRRAKCLDLATGNGLVARWLVDHGYARSVLATDASSEMLRIAKGHFASMEYREIATRQMDVTSDYDWSMLIGEDVYTNEGQEQEGGFDVVVMNMALMDVETIEPLANALAELLRPEGVFVATLLHPVFVTSNAAKSVSISFNPETGEQQVIRGRLVTEYLDVPPFKGIAVPGQPVKQMYYHRPCKGSFRHSSDTGWSWTPWKSRPLRLRILMRRGLSRVGTLRSCLLYLGSRCGKWHRRYASVAAEISSNV
ncbi:S-adenosyl-L-methionine-dependent methyltransferase [Podospora australis]|uniref:S-adenosyl-L-methionine-dependent methyltransferase n=1 Tax=Podospora australis TaxID=1536484 RepID=A0AAN7ABE7_9PEZI|nr:S-adenosyl-L-methionine-dependent methyltransferase [Podospora australis]